MTSSQTLKSDKSTINTEKKGSRKDSSHPVPGALVVAVAAALTSVLLKIFSLSFLEAVVAVLVALVEEILLLPFLVAVAVFLEVVVTPSTACQMATHDAPRKMHPMK